MKKSVYNYAKIFFNNDLIYNKSYLANKLLNIYIIIVFYLELTLIIHR